MKRRVKKCVSAFLALMLLTTLLPAAGFAADEQRATSNEQRATSKCVYFGTVTGTAYQIGTNR